MTGVTRLSELSMEAVDSIVSFRNFSPTQVENLLHSRRRQDRYHHVDEAKLGLMRRGGRFRRVVVAHQRQHTAVLRRAHENDVAEDVATAVDARPIVVLSRKTP